MAKNKSKKLPHFKSLDRLVEFFDKEDLGEYWDQLAPANFEVELKKKIHIFAIDAKLANRLTEIAISKQISSEELINDWLKEKISESR